MICLLISIPLLVLYNVDCILNFRGSIRTHKFYKQLERIPVYYVKDQNGNIVKHVYKSLGKGTINSNLWSPRRIKNPEKIVEWDITTDSLPSSVVPFFIEEELAISFSKSLGKDVKVIKATLADYLKWSEKWKEDTCVLFPDRRSLDLCTKNSAFTGTPIFITNPPILAGNGGQQSYVFFQSPRSALSTLGKLFRGEKIVFDGKPLNLGSKHGLYNKLLTWLGLSDMRLPGFELRHFSKVNNHLHAISVELLASLVYTHSNLANRIIVMP